MDRSALHSIAIACALVLFSGVATAQQQDPRELATAVDELSLTAVLAGIAGTLVVFLLIAAVLIHLKPEYANSTNRHIRSEPVTTGLIGFGVIVGAVIVSFVLILTVLGALVGLPLLLALVVVSFVGTVIAEITVGRYLLEEFADRRERPPTTETLWLAFGIGFVLVVALTYVPIVGGVVGPTVSSVGIGAMVQQYRNGSESTDGQSPGVEDEPSWTSDSGSSSWDDSEFSDDGGWDDTADGSSEWGTQDDDGTDDRSW
jgi:uncharacterized membrane protein YidH (DUF202 family)